MTTIFQIANWSILVYGVIVLLGGVMGYLKAKSKVSLLAGSGSGIALLAAWLISRQFPLAGLGLATAIGLILCIVFVMRLLRTRSFMPSGMMMVGSLVATVVFVLGLLSTGGVI